MLLLEGTFRGYILEPIESYDSLWTSGGKFLVILENQTVILHVIDGDWLLATYFL